MPGTPRQGVDGWLKRYALPFPWTGTYRASSLLHRGCAVDDDEALSYNPCMALTVLLAAAVLVACSGAGERQDGPSEPLPACPDEQPEGVDWMALGPFPVGYRDWQGTLTYEGATWQHLLQLVYPATFTGEGAPVDSAGGPYPLLIFEHAYGSSYDQYDWFFDVLASRGWIVASPEHDANGWNTTSDLFDGHAFLARQTIETLVGWSEDPDSEWAGAIDVDRVALGGHSHGGGGVLRASRDYGPLAPEAEQSISAIVLVTTRPDLDSAYEMYQDTYAGMAPLLNIGGAYDQDGTTAYGASVAVYEPHGRPGGMLYVDGAEHYSFTDEVSDDYAVSDRHDVHAVAGGAIVSFLAATVEGDADALAAWRGDQTPRDAGEATSRNQWHDETASVLDAMEADDGDPYVSDNGLEVVADGALTFAERSGVDAARGLYLPTSVLEWAWEEAGAAVTWEVGNADVTATPVLSLRLLAVDSDPLNPSYGEIELDVEIEDAHGTVAAWSLSESAQGGVKPTPEWLQGTTPKSVFETWRVPVRAMRDRTDGFDPTRIVAVRLVATSPTGRLLVDDIEWTAGEGCW